MSTVEERLYPYLIAAGFVSAAVVFVSLFLVTAPYGRHTRAGWGPTLNNSLGWLLMEVPAVVAVAYFFMLGNGLQPGAVWVLIVMWEIHYLHRAFIFPFRLKSAGKRMPIAIVALAVVFNVYNGYLNGRYLGVHADLYMIDWLIRPRFLLGVALFFGGLAINLYSDQVLFHLRGPGETGYKIPRGGLFRIVSCPNYLGELLEWGGWALATWSLPGLVFAVWTAANLVPRACAHHRWYKTQFPDYPPKRKAVIPFLL